MPFLMKLKGMLVSIGDLLAAQASDLNPYYSAWMALIYNLIHPFTPDHTNNKTMDIDSSSVMTLGDDVANGISLTIAEPTLSLDTDNSFMPTATETKSPVVTRELGYQFQMTGYIYDLSGSMTDKTTAANNATANDVDLAYAAVNDASYFGYYNATTPTVKPNRLWLNLGISGAGFWTITWEYWDGAAWTALSIINDTTNNFRADAGMQTITFVAPVDWVTNAVNGVTAFWVRARVSAFISQTGAPKATQCWMEILHS